MTVPFSLEQVLGRPREEIRVAIVAAIAVVADTPSDEIQPEVRLDELGLDSLTFTEVLVEVEDRLGVEIPAEVLSRIEEIGQIETVADVFVIFDIAGAEHGD